MKMIQNQKEINLRLFNKHKKKNDIVLNFKDPIKLKKFITKQLKKSFFPNDITNIILSYIDDDFYIYKCLSNKKLVLSRIRNNYEVFPSVKTIGQINDKWYSNISPNDENNNKYKMYPFKTCNVCKYSLPCNSENYDKVLGFIFPNKNNRLKNNENFICDECIKKKFNM